MFGTYRYLLAILVAMSHNWPVLMNWSGYYSVFGFFILSGYLMTSVLTDTYGHSVSGITRFMTNRVLRLYPPYLIAALFAVCVYIVVPDDPRLVFNRFLYLPDTTMEWLQNIFLFGLAPFETKPILVGPAWSLTVELVYYFALAILLARWRIIVVLWLVLSLAQTAFSFENGIDFSHRYFTIIAGSLPFSTGAFIYHFKGHLKFIQKWHVFPAFALFIGNMIFTRYLWGNPRMSYGIYVSYLLCAYMVICLSKVDKSDVSSWVSRYDKFLGNLSYPVFLFHMACKIIVIWFLGPNWRGHKLASFVASLLLANLIAYAVFVLVEKNVNKVRDRIRMPKGAPVPEAVLHLEEAQEGQGLPQYSEAKGGACAG